MNNKVVVYMLTPERQELLSPKPDNMWTIKFHSKSRYSLVSKLTIWLQRCIVLSLARWRVLDLHRPEPEYSTNYKKIVLDLNDLSEQLMKHEHAVYHLFNKKCDTIIVGHDVMKELRFHPDIAATIPVPTSRAYAFPYGKGLSFAGMTIKLVPWFEGILVLNMKDKD